MLCLAAIESWAAYTKKRYLTSLKWVLLDIKPPPDVQKSPKIAENIFSGLHSAYVGATTWRKRFFAGELQPWFSFEIVGNGGDIHFYVRVPEGLRKLVESLVFSQYPDAEITPVEDYIDLVPRHLPNDDYSMFGTELVFTKEDAYPIKTYPFFEEEKGKDEFVRTDPLSPLAEALSSLQPGEHIWLQLLIRATGGDWVKEGQKVIDKIIGKEPKVEKDAVVKSLDFIDSLISGVPAAEEKKKEDFSSMKLTPGQRFVLEQVENKLSKLGFKSGYRFLYIGRKEAFNLARISDVIGTFKQLYSNNLNSFRPNKETFTFAKGWFSWLFPSEKGFFYKQEELKKKWHIYRDYRSRAFVKQPIILNTEELATLFHLPSIGVRAPAVPRVEAKKGQPPTNLPGLIR